MDELEGVKARRIAREDWFVSREPARWYDDGSCRYCGKDQAGADFETGDLHEPDCPAASEPEPDIDWLVGEVERLRQGDEFSRMHAEMVGLHKGFEVKEAEVQRLRGLLARLEWAGCDSEYIEGNLEVYQACPVCPAHRNQWGHDDPIHTVDCWLGRELGHLEPEAT